MDVTRYRYDTGMVLPDFKPRLSVPDANLTIESESVSGPNANLIIESESVSLPDANLTIELVSVSVPDAKLTIQLVSLSGSISHQISQAYQTSMLLTVCFHIEIKVNSFINFCPFQT